MSIEKTEKGFAELIWRQEEEGEEEKNREIRGRGEGEREREESRRENSMWAVAEIQRRESTGWPEKKKSGRKKKKGARKKKRE